MDKRVVAPWAIATCSASLVDSVTQCYAVLLTAESEPYRLSQRKAISSSPVSAETQLIGPWLPWGRELSYAVLPSAKQAHRTGYIRWRHRRDPQWTIDRLPVKPIASVQDQTSGIISKRPASESRDAICVVVFTTHTQRYQDRSSMFALKNHDEVDKMSIFS